MVARDVERAERVMTTWSDLEEWDVGNYVIMRNLYMKKMMRGKAEEMARKVGMVKETGVSYVAVGSRVSEFVSGGGGIEKEVVECLRQHMEEHSYHLRQSCRRFWHRRRSHRL